MLDVPSQSNEQEVSNIRSDWTRGEIQDLFKLPLNDLLYRAHTIHRAYWQPNQVQLSTLLSIKTGGCPEDCKYCAQSSHYDTGLEADKLLDIDAVRQAAEAASQPARRGFAWVRRGANSKIAMSKKWLSWSAKYVALALKLA